MKNERLEKMDEFFARRVEGYDQHMLKDIQGADEFYPFTASLLPKEDGAKILDLGCGTGLELGYYFEINGTAEVTGIDLSAEMLKELQKKFADKNLTVVQGSYFDWNYPWKRFDAAVSVESLHHFTPDAKLTLYRKILGSLKENGYFILTDYFAESEQMQEEYFRNLEQLKKSEGLDEDEFYHYDTPLTLDNEIGILRQAGFGRVDVLGNWGATYTIRAKKRNSFKVDIDGKNKSHGLVRDHFVPGEKVVFSVMTATDTSYYITSSEVKIQTQEYSVGGLSWFWFIMPEQDVKISIRSENSMTALNREPEQQPARMPGHRYCPECGYELQDITKFCPCCGRKLT